MKYPEPLQKLIGILRKFPGVGKKTAERYAFQMISWQESELQILSHLLSTLKKEITKCDTCGALTSNTCNYCDHSRRDPTILCIVSSPKDIFSIEATGIYNGLYHVVAGLLSPLDGFGSEKIDFNKLKMRILNSPVKEVILALDATVEGDATALFLKKELESEGVFTSRLALGMPLGSTLDFLDEGTLGQALFSRLPI